MVAFRQADLERVNAFEVEETYLFKHYFDEQAVFDRLEAYYNTHQYRFEVPRDDFGALRTFLADHGYGLVVVDAVEEFVVVVEQYTAHPENIFKESVIQREVEGFNCFLMTDRRAVETATGDSATRLTEAPIANPF